MDETKRKLTDTQLRALQIVLGIISAAALIAALFVPTIVGTTNTLLTYLWLVIFVVVMFGRRWIERRFNLRLALYNLVMLVTLATLILIYASILFFSPATVGAEGLEWSMALKLVIVIGVGLLILVLGIALPLMRYVKRRDEGTLRPIRLPEPEEIEEEEEEKSTEDAATAGMSPLERQIMEMTKDLDGPKDDADGNSDSSDSAE